jgi:hypothetical protein
MLVNVRSKSVVVGAVAVISGAILLGIGLHVLFRSNQAEGRHRVLNDAQLVAAKIDMYFGALENLLTGLSMAISTNPSDVDANDAILRRLKSELPSSIANIFILSRDGRNIGNAVGQHASAGDREYFQKAIAGASLVVGAPIFSRSNVGRVLPIARPIKNSAGEIQGVLVVATFLGSLADVIGINNLPAGSVVKIVDEEEIEVVTISNAAGAPELHLFPVGETERQFQLKDGSKAVALRNDVGRIVGLATMHRASWFVAVGLPMEAGLLRVAGGL